MVQHSVTILIACRNEKNNIEPTISRMPPFGTHQEFIFIEGDSTDGTYDEIIRVIAVYPKKDIKLLKQEGKGKANAIWLGISKAKGELIIILDADLTVRPEDTIKFYKALEEKKGEFINGNRMSCPMEKGAMPFLNYVGNQVFAFLFSWLSGQHFSDTLCGTKAGLRAHFVEFSQMQNLDPFGDFALIWGALQRKLTIFEIPIYYQKRRYGTTNIHRFFDALILLRLYFILIFTRL
jgi:glycosyltransferase involved in cell wall biosynthesis